MQGFFHEAGLGAFLALTVAIGGGMAFSAGGAVARGWDSIAMLAFYTLLLTLAERFLQFALFDGTLLSVPFFVLDFAILLAFALLGFRLARRSQMARQYGFLAGGSVTR